jgi:hypothetical protein
LLNCSTSCVFPVRFQANCVFVAARRSQQAWRLSARISWKRTFGGMLFGKGGLCFVSLMACGLIEVREKGGWGSECWNRDLITWAGVWDGERRTVWREFLRDDEEEAKRRSLQESDRGSRDRSAERYGCRLCSESIEGNASPSIGHIHHASVTYLHGSRLFFADSV